jgi:hypothetical protein
MIRNQKGLGDAGRPRLFTIIDGQTPGFPVAQKLRKRGRSLRRGDQAQLAHPVLDQRGQRIIDHRLVIDRLQLFAGDQGQRV